MSFAALLLLLALPASAQDAPEETWDFPPWGDCGLVTRYASNKIPSACLTQGRNIYLDEDWTLKRRLGQSKYNATPCQDSKAVRGLWAFDSTDGNKYLIIFSSQSFFKTSGSGDCTQIASSTFSATATMRCVQTLGKLWCTNGTDTPISIDSNLSTASISAMPLGELIGAFRNRVVVAKIAGSLTRIRLSGEGDGTDWSLYIPGKSTTSASIDIAGTNDGSPVTCLLGEYQNAYYIGRDRELYALYGNDRRDFVLRKVSNQIGCIEPESAREKNNALYWMSRRGVERLTGTEISRVSDPIRPDIDQIISAAGNTVSVTDTLQADFEAGNLTASGAGAPLSATLSPGNVVGSTWAAVDTSSGDFNSGTLTDVSSTAVSGSLMLSETATTHITDAFTDGDYTSNPAWTVTQGAYSASGGVLLTSTLGTYNVISSPSDQVDGTWSFTHQGNQAAAGNLLATSDCAAGTIYDYRFMKNAGNSYYAVRAVTLGSGVSNVRLIKNIGGSETTLGNAEVAYVPATVYSFVITKTTNGYISVTRNGSALFSDVLDTAISSSTKLEISAGACDAGFGQTRTNQFDMISSTALYKTSGTFISQVFDTGLSTPTWGVFQVGMSSSTETPITFEVQSATSASGVFESLVSQSNGVKIAAAQRQYVRYKGSFSTSVSSKTPTLHDAGLSAATTGYFISQCRNPGTAITSWNNFACNSTPYHGTISFAVSTGATCNAVTRTTATWNTQTNNSPITISTAAFVAYRSLIDFSIFYSTVNIALQDCTLSWNEGSSRPQVVAEVHRDRYYLFYTTSTASGAANDHALLLDQNDKWTMLDGINASAAEVYKNKLHTGSSGATGLIYIQESGHSDDGSSYTMNFKTADLDFGDPTQLKSFKTLYVYLKSEDEATQDIPITFRYTIDGSTTTYSLGDCNLDEAAEVGYFTCKLPFPVSNAVDAHWLALEGEYAGLQGPVRIYGLKFVFARKARE